MTDRDLEHALDELYRVDPSEFVALRKRLAAGLRGAGNMAATAEVRAARRPSTSAWALNQLARRRPELIEEWLERSRALLYAQTRAFTGAGAEMRDAISAHRETLEAATQAALAILGPRSHDAFRSEIVATLRAASTDEDVGQLLRLGRLVREPGSSMGFPDVAGLTVTALSATADGSRRKPERPKVTDTKISAEPETPPNAEHEAHRRAELAARAEAQRLAEAAESNVVLAQARVAQLERDLGRARQDLLEARERSKKAKAEARRASTSIRGT
jgi:hypothetical protein